MNLASLLGEVSKLGECRIPSPMTVAQFVRDEEGVLYHSERGAVESLLAAGERLPAFEKAGPRETIYFDPAMLQCGIVTCGGLCPGINDVIRAIVMSLFHHYGVRTVFGFRHGFEGLSPRFGHTPLELTPTSVASIHERGGTILGSSRGPQDVGEMVDTLERLNVGALFAIGGDGTLHGTEAIANEVTRRGLKISVIGIPKTIDNDIPYVEQSFGFETAVCESKATISSANLEALGARNGIGLVKLMGRHAGFIAAYATLANNDVNYCLIPEVQFTLDAFLASLRERIARRGHAVIVVGEGAGQDLIASDCQRDASGNLRLGDIGVFLRDRIIDSFKQAEIDTSVKYIDPSYTLRSVPANPHDSVLCLLLGHNAVHAAMAGRTSTLVGYWRRQFTHVPIPVVISQSKQVDPSGWLWSSVLASTGQPRGMR